MHSRFFSTSFSSTVSKGKYFEDLSLKVLSCYSFYLQQRGGSGDLGIDLQGIWQIYNKEKTKELLLKKNPKEKAFINIIGQCKYEKKYIKPSYIRELDGVLSRCNNNSQDFISSSYFIPQDLLSNEYIYSSHLSIPLIGLLISSKGFTTNCITALQNSKNPMIFLTINPQYNENDDILLSNQESSINLMNRLQFFKLNKPAQDILPSLIIGNTFTSGTYLENNQPSLVLYNEGIDISSHKLP